MVIQGPRFQIPALHVLGSSSSVWLKVGGLAYPLSWDLDQSGTQHLYALIPLPARVCSCGISCLTCSAGEEWCSHCSAGAASQLAEWEEKDWVHSHTSPFSLKVDIIFLLTCYCKHERTCGSRLTVHCIGLITFPIPQLTLLPISEMPPVGTHYPFWFSLLYWCLHQYLHSCSCLLFCGRFVIGFCPVEVTANSPLLWKERRG